MINDVLSIENAVVLCCVTVSQQGRSVMFAAAFRTHQSLCAVVTDATLLDYCAAQFYCVFL